MLFPAIAILFSRDVLVSGLRELKPGGVPVSAWWKLKTALQFISIFLLLLGSSDKKHALGGENNASENDRIFYSISYKTGVALLYMSTVLSCLSALRYTKAVFSKSKFI